MKLQRIQKKNIMEINEIYNKWLENKHCDEPTGYWTKAEVNEMITGLERECEMLMRDRDIKTLNELPMTKKLLGILLTEFKQQLEKDYSND